MRLTSGTITVHGSDSTRVDRACLFGGRRLADLHGLEQFLRWCDCGAVAVAVHCIFQTVAGVGYDMKPTGES